MHTYLSELPVERSDLFLKRLDHSKNVPFGRKLLDPLVQRTWVRVRVIG